MLSARAAELLPNGLGISATEGAGAGAAGTGAASDGSSSRMIPLMMDFQNGFFSSAAAEIEGSAATAAFICSSVSLRFSSSSSSLSILFCSLFVPIVPASLEIGEFATMKIEMIRTVMEIIRSPGMPKSFARMEPISMPITPPFLPSTP